MFKPMLAALAALSLVAPRAIAQEDTCTATCPFEQAAAELVADDECTASSECATACTSTCESEQAELVAEVVEADPFDAALATVANLQAQLSATRSEGVRRRVGGSLGCFRVHQHLRRRAS
jgi:hypothetical protein